MPTAAERSGDFSGLPLAGCTPATPTDPLTGAPFPGDVIPANRLNPAGLALVELYRLPNNRPTSGCNNYVAAVPAPIDWDQINARVDWNVGKSARVLVRYTQDAWKAAHSMLWAIPRRRLSPRTGTSPAGRSWPSSTGRSARA